MNAVAIASNGKRVISGSRDKTLKVWDFDRKQVIASLTMDGMLQCCAIATDKMEIVAGDEFGVVHFLRLEEMQMSG